MKLSRNKIAKLLKSGNQSRKNNQRKQAKFGKSKSLSALGNQNEFFNDDELILQNNPRHIRSIHKRGPLNLRLKTMKKRNYRRNKQALWEQEGGLDWAITEKFLNVEQKPDVLKSDDIILANLNDTLSANPDNTELKYWQARFTKGEKGVREKFNEFIQKQSDEHIKSLKQNLRDESPENQKKLADIAAKEAQKKEKAEEKEAKEAQRDEEKAAKEAQQTEEKAAKAIEKTNINANKENQKTFNVKTANKMLSPNIRPKEPMNKESQGDGDSSDSASEAKESSPPPAGKIDINIVTKYTKPESDTRKNAPPEFIKTKLEIDKPSSLEALKKTLSETDQGILSIDEYVDSTSVFFSSTADKLLLNESTPITDANVASLNTGGEIIIRAEGVKLTLIGKTGDEMDSVDFMLSVKIEEVYNKWKTNIDVEETDKPANDKPANDKSVDNLRKYLLFFDKGKNDTVWVDYEGKDKGKTLKQLGITGNTTFRIRSKLYVFFERLLYKDLFYLIDIQYIRNVFNYLSTCKEVEEYTDLIQAKPFKISTGEMTTAATEESWEDMSESEGGMGNQLALMGGAGTSYGGTSASTDLTGGAGVLRLIFRKEAERDEDVKFVGFPIPEYTPPIDPATDTEKYLKALLAEDTNGVKDDELFNSLFMSEGSTKEGKEKGINELIAKVDKSLLSKIKGFIDEFSVCTEAGPNFGNNVIPPQSTEAIISNYLDTKKEGFMNFFDTRAGVLNLKPFNNALDAIEANRGTEDFEKQKKLSTQNWLFLILLRPR